jgi:hypothetical protein
MDVENDGVAPGSGPLTGLNDNKHTYGNSHQAKRTSRDPEVKGTMPVCQPLGTSTHTVKTDEGIKNKVCESQTASKLKQSIQQPTSLPTHLDP